MKVKIVRDNFDMDVAHRQKIIRGWKQDKIANSRVLVVGVGALGNEIVKNLVLLGFGNITIMDFDTIVASNLNRCVLFRKSDVGKHKVDVVAERAKELDPYGYIEIKPLNMDLTTIEPESCFFKNFDICVSALDSLYVRLHLNSACVYNDKPLVDGGMEGYIGYVQVVIPKLTACLQCTVSERDMKILDEKLSCAGSPLELIGPKIAAIPTTTSIIAGIMTQEIIKLILTLDDKDLLKEIKPLAGKRLYYNGALNIVLITELMRNPKCIVCGNYT